jgi:hypothetical protein
MKVCISPPPIQKSNPTAAWLIDEISLLSNPYVHKWLMKNGFANSVWDVA